MDSIAETVERLLGRRPEAADGIEESLLAEAESALGQAIPSPLREFYRLAGNNAMLMDGFNFFARPEQLGDKDGKILFLGENQEVCFWGFEAGQPDPLVFMQPCETNEWHGETPLGAFLPMVLHYQCAQGGYEHCGLVGLDKEEADRLLGEEWEPVVRHNGLFIARKPDCLLWWLEEKDGTVVDDCVYFSARTEGAYEADEDRYCLELL